MNNAIDINQTLDQYYWYAFKVASKIFYNYYSSLPYESSDLHQISALAIMDGTKRFDPNKNNNFDAYLRRYISLYIIGIFKKETTNKRKILNFNCQKENVTDVCWKSPEHFIKLQEVRDEIRKILKKYRPKDRRIILNFLDGSKIHEIVKELNLQKHKVSYVIHKFKNEIINNDLIKMNLNY
ncbi:sigma-70 family RNA polymerase sigma factor [Mycoplasma sp. E35C]|nr:sigma-70 family RNA polymerase sigma factor [Mycoplasma sp. E35C]